MLREEKYTKALELLDNAEASLKAARTLLMEISPADLPEPDKSKVLAATAYEEEAKQVVEGTFDGQNMIGPAEKIYPVPANYASKSKLVEGDRLKLTIMPNGSFLYKQISPVDREFLKGTLVKEDGQFKVITEDKSYRVLLASVTYYKGEMGDEITIIVPKDGKATWAAIEAVIPQVNSLRYDESQSY